LGLLARLNVAESFETWPTMERAAEARFWDGMVLAIDASDHSTGAVYLLGYVVEMLLKTAYFQMTGVSTNESLEPYLQQARKKPAWTGRNLHDLKSWAALINEVRFVRGKAWSPILAGSIERHVLIVSSHWRESLRYTSFTATNAELEEVLTSVGWLRANYDLLWS